MTTVFSRAVPTMASAAAGIAAAVVVAVAPSAAAAQQAPAPVFVSTQWLAEQAGDPDLVVVHVGMEHDEGSVEVIPGSVFLGYHGITTERNGLSTEVPPVADLVERLQSAGISNSSRVVLYGSPLLAARAYLTLDYLGHGARTSVLDGGLERWKLDERGVADAYERPGPGDFAPHVRDDIFVSAEWIRERLDDPRLTVMDARPVNEYTGERDQQGLRGGHIPGAYNLFWSDAIESRDNPVVKASQVLREHFEAAGATADSDVVSYCYIGMRASYMYLLTKHLGYTARFYDGSWDEWGADEELPVVAGASRRD